MLLIMVQLQGQGENVKVIEEKNGLRTAFYAINEDEQAYDVLFTVKGSNFRQSAAKPRWIRVPQTSKVHLKTIILYRDKTPQYTHSLKVNDSLSRRALKKEYTVIEVPPKMITPKKQITIYRVPNCTSCDSIVQQLRQNRYIFTAVDLSEKTEVKDYLSKALQISLDSLRQPVVNLGGHLYSWIKDYDALIAELEK